jgi:hypothetical protein
MNCDKTNWNDASTRSGDELRIELTYPRSTGHAKFICIGLMDVRGADDIRISYDFDRDGWRIEQASVFAWDADDPVCDPDWQEVAFCTAWARKPDEP